MTSQNNPAAPQPERANTRQHDSSAELADEPLLEIAENLIWALLDDQISAAQCSQLEQLILDHEQVRRRYLECMQLHVDLRSVHRREVKSSSSLPVSPVLGTLDVSYPMISPSTETGPPSG